MFELLLAVAPARRYINATVDVDIWNMLTSTAVDVDIVTFTLFCISFNTFLWLQKYKIRNYST